MSFSSHAIFKFLRVALLSVFMLAAGAGPVMTMLAELHDVGEVGVGHHEVGFVHDVDEDGEGGLLHCSHCPGHVTGIVDRFVVLCFDSGVVELPGWGLVGLNFIFFADLFRPPIRG